MRSVMSQSPVRLIQPQRFGDSRGWFAEVYSERAAARLGVDVRFVQDNHSYSAPAFTLRGLHFQAPPNAQAKLIRCLFGRIFDVVVDVRRASPTYGRWTAAELTAENGRQLFVPAGFAHGFLTLEPDCEVAYKVSAFYDPPSDGGIRWDSVGIDWPLPAGRTLELSDKDRLLPALADFDSPFPYDGRPLAPLD